MNESKGSLINNTNALRESVRAVRSHWRRRVMLEGISAVAIAMLLALLAGVALALILGPGSSTVAAVRVTGYALIAATLVRFLIVPVFRRSDDTRIALYVEERAPELRQALLSAVHELDQPVVSRASPALTARMNDHAVRVIGELGGGAVLERPRLRRASGVLAGASTLGLVLALFGPGALRDVASVLFVPWSTASAAALPGHAVMVSPGNITLPRGASVDVSAILVGYSAGAAEVVVRTEGADEWMRLPMVRDSAGTGFVARLFDVTVPTQYFVESDGVRSRTFAVAVVDLPAVRQVAVELRYPRYTGLAAESIADGGDIAAVVGTNATVRASVTRPVRGGVLRFDDGTTAPLAVIDDSTLSGGFIVQRNGFYRIDLEAADGAIVPGTVQYAIAALEDRPPTVRIAKPGRDTKVTSVEELTIDVAASDDYGVGGVELRYSVNGGPEQIVTLADSARQGNTEFGAAHTFYLDELALAPGDLVSYHAVAHDGAGHRGSSDIYFLEVRPFGRDYRQAEQGSGAPMPGGGEGQAQSPDALSERQKEIVAATFNSIRDSATTPVRERRENVTTLAIAQGKLRDDVEALSHRLETRGMITEDTAFALVKAALDSSLGHMHGAEEALGRAVPRAALPPEQRALQYLQRAQAIYREVQLQQQQGGGGGGGGGGQQRQNEELADLFEMDTDRLRNQYEAVQREASTGAQQEVDEAAERLRQLASRQQQENERAQRMAEALRDRLGRESGGSGGGSAQRDLARQVEEEARRLERLSRERQSPELAEAARRTQEAADAMRRAATGATDQGSAAVERLRRASRQLDQTRATETRDGVRQLGQRAEALARRQDEIANDVAGLQGASPTARAEQAGRFDQRKDALGQELDGLRADAERLARDARREQPQAATQIADAMRAVREGQLRERIEYSKRVVRNGSLEYAQTFEGQIAEQLDSLSARLGAASAAVGESAQRRQERALERTRDLVRNLESLRERTAARGQPGAGQRPGQGQGEGQGQGNGQRPGQGQGEGQGQANGQRPTQSGSGNANGAFRGGTGRGDPRAEFGVRRRDAEEIRRDLSELDTDVRELDGAIAAMRRLETEAGAGGSERLDRLQAALIESVKGVEFALWRRFGADNGRPTSRAATPAPAEYRTLVEEYYRSIGKRGAP